MKSSFLLATLSAICLFCSCSKKDSPAAPDTDPGKTSKQKRAVEFRLSGFTQSTGEFRDSLLDTQARSIFYFAYDSAGHEVSFIEQKIENTDFGRIRDSLAPGNYTIVMIASQFYSYQLFFGDPRSSLPGASFAFYDEWSGQPYFAQDSYFKKFALTVNETDTAVTTALTLNRVVGKLEVNILDASPWVDPGGHKLTVTMNAEILKFSFANSTSIITETRDSLTRPITRVANKQFSDVLLNTSVPFTITIKDFNPYTNVTYTKIIHNVRCYQNKRTILTGNIFDGTVDDPGDGNPGGFKISVNDTWDADTVNIDF